MKRSIRRITVTEGQNFKLNPEEIVLSAEWDSPRYYHLIVLTDPTEEEEE